MRRLAGVLLALLLPVVSFADGMPVKYRVAVSEGGAGLVRGLTFHAPLDDPANPLKIYKGTGAFTFVRAHDATHTATYVHAGTGLVTVATDNQLRIEAAGALIEGARTNLARQSGSIGTSPWVASGTGGKTFGVTLSNADVLAPDGSSGTVTRMQTSATPPSAGEWAGIYQPIAGSAVPYTISIRARTLTGNYSVYISTTPDGVATHSTRCDLTPAWQRFTLTATLTAVTWYSQVGSDMRGDSTQVQLVDSKEFYVDDYQYEIGSTASSDIPTGASNVSRNADVLSLPTAGNMDNTAGTITLSWSPTYDNNMAVGAAYYLFDAGTLEAYYNATDQKIYFTDGANTISTAALSFSANATMNLAFTWGASGLAIVVDGAQTTGATYTASTFGASCYIGSDSAQANSGFARHKHIRIWDRVLTGTEIQSIRRGLL